MTKCNEPISIITGKSDRIFFNCVRKHYHKGDHKWRMRVETLYSGMNNKFYDVINNEIIEFIESEIKLIPIKPCQCGPKLIVFKKHYNTILKSYFNCILDRNHTEKHKWLIELGKPIESDKKGEWVMKGAVVDENNIKKLKEK